MGSKLLPAVVEEQLLRKLSCLSDGRVADSLSAVPALPLNLLGLNPSGVSPARKSGAYSVVDTE